MSLDVLIDTLVSDAQLEAGLRMDYAVGHGGFARAHASKTISRMPVWSAEEERFLEENLGRLGVEGVALALGRSPQGVDLHYKRRGIAAPSKQPGYLTANQVASLLGVAGHKPCGWIDRGIMPGERLAWSVRTIRRVSIVRLKMWLCTPASWIYVDVRKIRQASLRRLVELAQAKWDDEWWSTNQAAAYHGCDNKDILRYIQRGKLPAIQARHLDGRKKDDGWAWWFARKSDVLKLRVVRGRGEAQYINYWPPRADAFILRARSEGKTFEAIARMMKWPIKRVQYRERILRRGQLSAVSCQPEKKRTVSAETL